MKNKTSRWIALLLTLSMLLPMVLTGISVSGAEGKTASLAKSSEMQGPVALTADTWDFASDSQAESFSFYNSGTGSFSIKDGMLVPSAANGEMKAIANTDVEDIKFVSVDIIPGASGLINAGLYIGASDVADPADNINALAFLVESWFSGWSDAPNRIDLVTGEFPTWTEHKRLISETGNGNALFKGGVKEPLNLRVDFSEDMVTVTLSLVSNAGKYVQSVFACDPAKLVGSVGVRANNSDVCFDNFKIGYERAVPEKLQQGLEFSVAGAKAPLNNATGMIPQTVEAWVKVDPATTADRTAIIGAFKGPYTADAQKGDWALFTNGNGVLWWYEKNANGQYSTAKGPTIKTGEWVHVAIARTEGAVTYYINGAEIATGTGNIVLNTASTKAPTLGYCEYGGENYNYLKGSIGDVRLWSTTRTAAQIQEDMFAEATGSEEGLMHHWALDEQAGTVFWDSAASENHGSIANNTGLTWTEGSGLNEGLEFNTVGAKATLSQATSTIPQTVEAWVKVDTDTAASRTAIIGAFTGPYTADAQKGDWALFTDGSGKLWWYEKNANGQYSSAKGTSIKTGDWVHVAITRAEGTIKYYINGSEVATNTGNIVLDTASSKIPTLGYCEYGGENVNYLDGALGDVRLWSTTRTQEEIRSTMYTELTGTETGLMSCWKLDEQNGVNIADSAATANHGTIDVAWLKDNQGLEFAGKNQAFVTLEQSTGTIPQTVEAWVKVNTDTAASRTAIIGAFTGTGVSGTKQGDWALFTDGSGRVWWFERNANGTYSSAKGTSIKTGEWVHVAVTRSEGTVNYYLNGELAATNTGNVVLDTASTKIPTLGFCEYSSTNGNYLDGALRDVRLWSTTRTAEEIKANINATLSGKEEGLMSYWKLDEQSGATVKDSAAAGNDGTIAIGPTWTPGIVAETAPTPEQTYENEGFNFSQNKTFITSNEQDISPDHTIEAWVKIPQAVKSANVIAQNNILTRYEFSVTAGGAPRLYWKDENDTVTDIVVSAAKVNTGKWTHVAFVCNASAKTVTCYVNGTAVHVEENVVLNDIVIKKLYVGKTLLGLMGDLRLWNKPLTAAEIKASMATAYEEPMTGLQLNVPFDEATSTSFRDLSGNGNTVEVYTRRLEWSTDNTQPKDYSIVVIPDQQVLSGHYPEYLDDIYRWIAENAEEENIKFAINLGDITDYNSEEEWLLSLEALELIQGVVPYSFVPGNHEYFIPGSYKYTDYGYRNLTEMNKYFGNIYDKQSEFGGSYDGGVENTWHEFEAYGHKYLVLALEYYPRDSVLAWASEVIEAHSYHQVIVSTHSYMLADGTRNVTVKDGFVYEDGQEQPNSGKQMWDEFLSQHENIIMSLCGHISTDDVVPRIDEGVKGNQVLQMLIDGQDLDHYYRGGGFLALMRFDANGENMELTYFSPYRGENGEDEYLNDNVLSFTMPAPTKEPVAQVGENSFTTVADAISNANGEAIKILKDTDEAITINADVTIDLAGCTLSNVTVAEGVKLNLIDSTATYSGTKGSATVTGSVEKFTANGEDKYMVIGENSVYAPHRYYVGLTHVSLDTANTGFGYKARFYGDEVVQAQVAATGYDLWMNENVTVTRTLTGYKSLVTLRLKNFMVKEFGETPVNAKAFIVLKDGTRLESEVVSYSMRSMIELLNESYADFSVAQLQSVAVLIKKHETMQTWNVENILNILKPAATVEAITVENQEMELLDGTTNTFTLNGAYQFTAQDTEQTIVYSDYASWTADYYITMDAEAGEGLYLAGNYGSYGWVAIPVESGKTYTLVPVVQTLLGKSLTYEEMVTNVVTFSCGVADTLGNHAGATVTVELRLTNPENPEEYIILNTTALTLA